MDEMALKSYGYVALNFFIFVENITHTFSHFINLVQNSSSTGQFSAKLIYMVVYNKYKYIVMGKYTEHLPEQNLPVGQ